MKPLACCTDAFPLPTCPTTINAWQIFGVFTAVDFVIRIVNNLNHVKYVEGTTGALGEFIIDLSSIAEGFFTTNYTYQMEVSVDSVTRRFFIGGITHECIAFCVESGGIDYIQPTYKDIPDTAAMAFFANDGVEVIEAGTVVVRWNDFGTFGFDAVQTNNAARPEKGINKVVFDGSNVMCADDPTLDLSGDYLQILARFKLTDNQAPLEEFPTIVSQYDAADGDKQAWALYLDNQNGKVFFDVIDNSGNDVKSRNVENLTLLNTEIAINAVFESGDTSIWANGIERELASFLDAEVNAILDLDTPVNIGANSNNAPAFSFAFAGEIMGVRIWNKKPSAAEWVYWYNFLNSI